MSDRRFTDKPDLDPLAVRGLPAGHPALVGNRTLFPTTVVDVDENFADRLLVSGENNRKLGKSIIKGKFSGYLLYGLSLEERATCPSKCDARTFCYGNGMQLARRHRISDLEIFNRFLEDEIGTILTDPVPGLMVRLHVLGDFPSVEYVSMWADLLDSNERLACYGYTHRTITDIGGDAIGDAIFSLKGRFPTRFRIRWSSDKKMSDGALIINRVPDQARIKEGIVCPAQIDAIACCASCGLCWDKSTELETIVFIKHGPKSAEAVLDQIKIEPKSDHPENVRSVAAVAIASKRNPLLSKAPEMRHVEPTKLKIESDYQRDLSGKSIKLIRKIVTNWDWAKFKPPICAATKDGLFIIDGQHTAIAAASHPDIKWIPVMVVSADQIERRAEAFVAHNRDRLTMTPAQVFYGDVAAANKEAREIFEIVKRVGATIPRIPVSKRHAKPGQITPVGEIRKIHQAGAPLERILHIATLARCTPISLTVVCGLRKALEDVDVGGSSDQKIAAALASIKNIEIESESRAAESGDSRMTACAALIVEALSGETTTLANGRRPDDRTPASTPAVSPEPNLKSSSPQNLTE